jgi:hypothetical protein
LTDLPAGCFACCRYAGAQAAFEDIPGCTVISNPIEVFSHTQYLNEKQDSMPPLRLSSFSFQWIVASNESRLLAPFGTITGPPPPVVQEVLPSAGPVNGGTRIVILGSNFINSSNLKVPLRLDLTHARTCTERGRWLNARVLPLLTGEIWRHGGASDLPRSRNAHLCDTLSR